MPVIQSERNWIEKIADAIPGISGYRQKEGRRDTDKRLREYLASRLDLVASNVDKAKDQFVEKGVLEGLDSLGRLSSMVHKAADKIRFAAYGYAGFFDQSKVREEELDLLYDFDRQLLDGVEGLLEATGTDGFDVADVLARTDALDRKIADRKTTIEKFK